MSEENAEIVRRAFTAALRKPKPDFETINELFHSDHVFLSTTSRVEGRAFRGAAGFREWLTDMNQTWDSWSGDVVQVTDLDNRVLCTMAMTYRSRGGVPLEREHFWLVTVRDGKVARTDAYETRAKALEAAGLSE
jgi:ketosteroid isomerase-like protein